MKKLILSASALLICGLGYSQVTDTHGTASPTSVYVSPLSGSAGLANSGESIQNGNDNRVRVRQAGALMSVQTIQSDGSGSGGNLADVRQTGNVAPPPSGFANDANVYQTGTANQSRTRQEGDFNQAITNQGQNDDGSARNRARIQQGTNGQAEGNYAAIDQDGNDNQANTLQTYDNNDAWTQQLGDDNKSLVSQDGGPNQTDGHSASVDQEGDNNGSIVMQSGAGARNTAVAVQLGDDNFAKQVQSTDAVAGGLGNLATVSQGDGSVNSNLVPTILFGQLDNVDDITNVGFSGDSFGGIAYQTQGGSDNESEIHQFGASGVDGNYAEQNQSGDSNDAMIVQNAFGNPSGGANYARQDQDDNASNSQAGIAQNGFNHKAYQRQTGDDNNIMSTQRGNGNLVNTYQDGDQNRGTTAQRGVDNQILLVQRGGHSYSVTQNLPNGSPVGSPNGGNQADILQLGPNGDFSADAIECVFEDQMSMPMPELGTFSLGDVCPGC